MNKAITSSMYLAVLGLLAPSMALAQGAARADFVSGPVMTVAADGTQRPLPKGGEVRSGETIVTGEGRAQLNFTDGAVVSLQPKTEFRIDDYNFVEADPKSEKGFFSLLKGALRTITGRVGKANRAAYRVSTTVATIGIRGTEYGARLDNGLTASTIAGEIEVCNNAGCTIVGKGQSAYAPDNNTKPAYTASQASQSPNAPPPPAGANLFTGGDSVTPTGGIPISLLASGPGYGVLYSGFESGTEFALPLTSGTATFDQAGRLSTFFDGTNTDMPSAHAEGMTDGTVAWGRWSAGTVAGYAVTDTHYVVGVPTPSSALAGLAATDFQGLGAGKATYGFMGATQPTAMNGTVGSGVSGQLVVLFTPGTATLNALLNVQIGGGSYVINGSASGFPSFSSASASVGCTGTCGGAGTTADMYGSFFGATAERAGLVYKFTGAGAMGGVTGAAAFSR
ncbi:MAG: FecR domain-containing protein [Verrucomicrobia subdivision 3 bacterium]|nr:FecR domain-containing protein [Limisphaerales bacterium]